MRTQNKRISFNENNKLTGAFVAIMTSPNSQAKIYQNLGLKKVNISSSLS